MHAHFTHKRPLQYIRDFSTALYDITVILLGGAVEHKNYIPLEYIVLVNFSLCPIDSGKTG